METSKWTEGPTPAGGDRMVTHFMDDQGSPTTLDKATKAEIVEYAGDVVVGRTYGSFEKSAVG